MNLLRATIIEPRSKVGPLLSKLGQIKPRKRQKAKKWPTLSNGKDAMFIKKYSENNYP